MRRPLPVLLGLASVLAIAAACSDSNAPAARTGRYELVSYDGASLPVVLRRLAETSTTPGGPTTNCDDKLTASTLELLKTGRFIETDSRLLVCDDGRADVASRPVLEGSYAAGADTVALIADVVSGVHNLGIARLVQGGLVLDWREAWTDGGVNTTDATRLVFRNALR